VKPLKKPADRERGGGEDKGRQRGASVVPKGRK